MRQRGLRLPDGLTAHTLAERPDLESRVRSLPGSYEEPNVWTRHPVPIEG